MKNKIYFFIIILAFNIVSCNTKVKTEDTKTVSSISESNSPAKLNEIWKSLPLKSFPVIDSTNFDNIIKSTEFKKEEIRILKLNKVYPAIEKENADFKVYPSYKIILSDEYYTLILNIYKGEHEIETLLINYTKDEKIISYKVISYDEIAEGLSRKHAAINKHIITVIDEFYGDKKQIDTTKFHINRNGEINQIKTKFSSNLRHNKSILLNKIYTDTIEFKSYNDEGDYFYLTGKNEKRDISLIYNWEWEKDNKYNFRNGDLIKVKWKMDSIWVEGDGGTLDFTERAIDAEKVK